MIHKQQSLPSSFAAWNLDNYTNLIHRAEKVIHTSDDNNSDVKPNHLSSLLEEYGELLSEKARHYLTVDFALGSSDDTSATASDDEKNSKLSEIIKTRMSTRFVDAFSLSQRF